MRHAEDQRLFTEENQERKNGLPDIRQVQETLKLLPDERIQQIFLPLLQEGVYPWDEEMAKRLTMVKNPSYHKYRDEDKAIKRYEERINNGRK
ncbi:MAG: hypothetical protein Q8O99_01730 [bacterium]|nr:hypothetical protein [bacterium]